MEGNSLEVNLEGIGELSLYSKVGVLRALCYPRVRKRALDVQTQLIYPSLSAMRSWC